jgi:hypothetical protein
MRLSVSRGRGARPRHVRPSDHAHWIGSSTADHHVPYTPAGQPGSGVLAFNFGFATKTSASRSVPRFVYDLDHWTGGTAYLVTADVNGIVWAAAVPGRSL